MTKTSHLRPRRGPGVRRVQAALSLPTELDQVVWQKAKDRARSLSVTTSSLVIDALVEYLDLHVELAGHE